MKKYLLGIAIIFLFACNNDNKEARSYLEKAKTLYETGEYNSAKQVLDSIRMKYPKEVDVLKESLFLMRQIELKEQERNLAFCDSMLIIRQIEADSIRSYFVFEKAPEYDTRGKYIEKKVAALFSFLKIQTGVYEEGDMYLKSCYSGKAALRHNQLKISTPTGEYAQTEIIPFDGGANYSFKDDNTKLIHETVTYQKGKDNGVIQFIYNHPDKKLTAHYLGGKMYSVVLSRQEIESLIKSADLSLVLLDIQKLQKEKSKAEERIKYLEKKL
jgi:hypothetical protein